MGKLKLRKSVLQARRLQEHFQAGFWASYGRQRCAVPFETPVRVEIARHDAP
jgi:hypothetical protein